MGWGDPSEFGGCSLSPGSLFLHPDGTSPQASMAQLRLRLRLAGSHRCIEGVLCLGRVEL